MILELSTHPEEIPPAVMRMARALMTAAEPSTPRATSAADADRLMSVEAAARKLGVSRMTVDRAMKAGEFPFVKFRRTYQVPSAFVEAVLRAAESGGQVVVEEYAAAWQNQ